MKENGLFAWLRRGKSQAADATPSSDAGRGETSEAVGSVPQAPPAVPLDLDLPPKHPLYWLWEFRNAEVGGQSPPRLSLSPDGGPSPLDTGTAGEELTRLRRRLTETAQARMQKAASQSKDGTVPSMDAEVVVYLPRDRLSAWIVAYPPTGEGQELTRSLLDKALAEANVVFGLDQALLDRLPSQPDRYFHLLLAARGVAPADGEDGRIVDCFPRKSERKFVVNAQNEVDYTTLNLVNNVSEGATICQIIPPTSGTPGVSVRGEPLPARDGKKPEVPRGRNTKLSEDGSRLVAVSSGHVEFTGRCFEVQRVLDIAGDVDYSTGTLNYLGDIHIHGDVRSGFTVRAMGSVRVDGVIEDTSVEAGGDLIVGEGVQGNGKAILRCHQNIYAKYLENCSVYVRGDLYSDCVVNCEMYCDGAVHVTTGRGVIIGGSTHSASGVQANIVGARTEVRTVVTLGGQPCEDYERNEVLREIQEMERDREKTERQPDSPAKQKRMSDLRLKAAINQMKLEKYKQRLAQRQEQPQSDQGSGCLRSKIVYPGTVVTIDGFTQVVAQEVRACTAVLMNEEVRFV